MGFYLPTFINQNARNQYSENIQYNQTCSVEIAVWNPFGGK
jgi:hypothetical protein